MSKPKRKKCIINGCEGGDHFYGLPKDSTIAAQWVNWIVHVNGEQPKIKYFLVCSNHFEEVDRGKVKLKPRAVPCLVQVENTQDLSTSQVVQEEKELEISTQQPQDQFDIVSQTFSTVVVIDTIEEVALCIEPAAEDDAVNLEVSINNFEELAFAQVTGENCVIDTDFDNSVLQDNVAEISSEEFNTEVINNEETVTLLQIPQESQTQSNFEDLAFCQVFEENCELDGDSHNPFLEDNMVEVSSEETNIEDQQPIGNKVPTRSKRRKCCAKDCFESGEKFHAFPTLLFDGQLNYGNLERFKVWMCNTGNENLLDTTQFDPFKKNFICCNHFDDTQYFNSSKKKIRANSVPTLFNNNPPLSRQDVDSFFVRSGCMVFHDIPRANSQDPYQDKFQKIMHSYTWRTCPQCNERFLVQGNSKKKCVHSKSMCLALSKLNDMDPGEAPEELKGLTYVEEQLIARIHPQMTVFKLNGHQFCYNGNIINFPQEVKELAKKLPHRVEELPSILTIRTRSEVTPMEFQVRNAKVRIALKWLIDNDPLYFDVEMSEENLELLPSDGNVYSMVNSVQNFQESDEFNGNETRDNTQSDTDSEIDRQTECSERDNNEEEEEICDRVFESSIPMTGKPSEKTQLGTILDWPNIDNSPVNEFTSVYVALAFPCLFPYGKADLNSPREHKIKPLNYFRHLMNYKDGRFAQHPRFRYFALNSIMRWSALTEGNVFVNHHAEFKDMTVNDLKEHIKTDPNILRKMMFQSSNLRGTRGYWYARGKELLAMVEQLRLPSLFFTLSAADFHWPDLYKVLVPDEDPSTISEQRRRKLIQDNPQIVDTFFYERSKVFIDEVLTKKFKVKDYWYRVEYQHRGSPHVHGLLWVENSPDVTDTSTEEKRNNIANFFGKIVSNKHPNINERPATEHPCRIPLSEVVDLEKDLAQLLNKVQRHTKCSTGYCLREVIPPRTSKCRFNFPKPMEAETTMRLNEKGDEYELIFERNDPLLNNHNPYVIQTWRANIDFSPVLSKQALVNYLAKYISKPEKESKQLMEVLQNLLDSTDDDKMMKSVVQRLYIQCCSERDYSAQEACHLLNGLKLVSAGGRKFVTINFSPRNEWIYVPKNGRNPPKSIFEKYSERQENFEDFCLYYMAKNFDFGNQTKYTKEAILQIYPKYKLQENSADTNDLFYRQQVLLYVPYRNEEEFLNGTISWKDVYQTNIDLITKNKDTSTINISDFTPEEDATAESEEQTEQNENSLEEWMVLSGMGPAQVGEAVELGRREIDLNFDWSQAAMLYEKYGGIDVLKSFIKHQKEHHSCNDSIPPFPDVTFSNEQTQILNLVDTQIKSITDPNVCDTSLVPRRIIVQGKAGTGKSLVIRAITHKIHMALGSDAYIIITPTGVSANAINGSTYHSKLRINSKRGNKNKTGQHVPLSGEAAHALSKELEQVRFIIVDEYSMIGCNAMHMIEDRISQVKGQTDEDFSSCFLFLFGDVKQLPPVADPALYSETLKTADALRGKLIFDNFEGGIILSNIQRQKDKTFQTVLNNIGDGTVTESDYEILSSRFVNAVSKEERLKYENAIHLYSTRLEVYAHNQRKLQSLKDNNGQFIPIARVPAKHNCKSAAAGTIDNAEGLHPVLYLSEGARIILKMNLWTEKGLVNGAMGTVVHILYETDCAPPNDPPAVVICRFDNYKGPFLDDEEKTLPIVPVLRGWSDSKTNACSRYQFPFVLSYACTIYSSQSLSLDMAFVNIGEREMATGITYVGLSRVKTLNGLLLEPFPAKRLYDIGKRAEVQRRNKWVENLKTWSLPELQAQL